VSAAAGFDVYGVVVRDDGWVDDVATGARREKIRSERRTWTPVIERFERLGEESFTAATGEPPRSVHEYVTARDDDSGRRVLACARCGTVLSDYRASYKDGLLVSETSVAILPRVDDPSFFLDEDMVLRRYCCPSCQVLMTVEIARRCEPALNEITFL
jgi:N-methylhydantoinase B